MADTDLPGGFGALNPPPRRVRPIASPFGMLPTDGLTPPQPGPPPGFNVQPTPPPSNPMAALSSFMPSGQDLKQGVADTLGIPVDMGAWLLHWMGAPIPGDKSYGGGTFNRDPFHGQPTWTPAPSVPLGSQNIRAMLDNPPSWDAILRAARRPGLF
jgi:hypothetical protein